MIKKVKNKEASKNYYDTVEWVGSRVSIRHHQKFQDIINLRKKGERGFKIRQWLEEKIDEEHKKIT